MSSALLFSASIPVYANDEVVQESKPKYVMGDTNGNGAVDTTDYFRIKQSFFGDLSLKGTAYAMADVDYNGIINTIDYLKVKGFLMGFSELDESVWEYEEKLPTAKYKTDGVYCSTRMYGTYDVSYCKGAICGDSNCGSTCFLSSTDVLIPVGKGISRFRVEDHELAEDVELSPEYDMFLYNGEVKLLEYVDETAEKNISVDLEGYGTYNLEYVLTEDYTFFKSHSYELKSPTENVSNIFVKVNAKTGEIFYKRIYPKKDNDILDNAISRDEASKIAKSYLKGVFADETNYYLRGTSVDWMNFEEKVESVSFKYYYPVKINGYKTDINIVVYVNKENGVANWYYEHRNSKIDRNYVWIFGVDKRSIDVDDSFETYKESIGGYETYIHDTQTRDLLYNDFCVTVTSGGTLGIAWDCTVYNKYTHEKEEHPYDDQTLVLAVPSKK